MLDDKTREIIYKEMKVSSICRNLCKKHGFELSSSDGIKDDKPTIIKFFIPVHNTPHKNKGFSRLIISYNLDRKEINFTSSFDDFNNFDKAESVLKSVDELIKERGNNADLNDIDTSEIIDMSGLFENSNFNGDISGWNVHNVEDMSNMFHKSEFNGDISNWDVSKVENMEAMFDMATEFNQPLNNWKLSSAHVTVNMFHSAYKFKQDLSSWDLRHIPVSRRRGMFTLSKMTPKYLPRFK